MWIFKNYLVSDKPRLIKQKKDHTHTMLVWRRDVKEKENEEILWRGGMCIKMKHTEEESCQKWTVNKEPSVLAIIVVSRKPERRKCHY